MERIAESELIINTDGTIFHLHLKPEEIADNIIVVGDPGRVDLIAKYFDSIEFTKENREFRIDEGFRRESNERRSFRKKTDERSERRNDFGFQRNNDRSGL